MQEMMKKAQELQRTLMPQMQAAMAESSSEGTSASFAPDSTSIPVPSVAGSNLLNADLNNSKLDELINPNSQTKHKKAKNEQEAKVLDAINRKDYSELSAVKATQYGVLDRLKELIESGETDAHKPDSENVYLLHWAAINNRIEIAKYLLGLNVAIDPVGGELESTPLNWAARSGHIQMVVFLLQNGANPATFDIEGFSTIHLSTMFGHSIVTAYLLAKGLDPDMKDKNGVTPLMFAAQRVHSRDPAQLLLTFSARMNVQDSKGNTPLHYCVAFNNVTVMKILLDKGASLDIKNHKGLDPVEFAIDRGKGSAASLMRLSRDDDRNNLPGHLRSIGKNKVSQFLVSSCRYYYYLGGSLSL
jgi:ankyrin repeat protein